MTVCSLLLAACLTAGPQVEVQGLSGKTHTGSLAAIDAETVRIESEDSGAQELSVNELRSLRFVDVAPTDEFAEPPAVEVWLVDGTRLAGSDIRLTVDKCTAQVEAIGEVTLPRDTVLAVRLAAATTRPRATAMAVSSRRPSRTLRSSTRAIAPEEPSFVIRMRGRGKAVSPARLCLRKPSGGSQPSRR